MRSGMMSGVTVHIALAHDLTRAAADVLESAGVAHILHGSADPVRAAEAAAGDDDALALIGPFRSRDVADAVEITAPRALPLIAPVATWAGVTRDDEPGCDDPARHGGTVLRLVARDTVVAQRIAADLRARELRALVIAGDHDYGLQLDGQLRMAGLRRAEEHCEADVVVLAGLAGEPEVERAAALAPLPVIAFDGIQGADLGEREILVALPFVPGSLDLTIQARRAAELIVAALPAGRDGLLGELRRIGPFDEHGDPVDPPVWLWRADRSWQLTPERAI
jgi:hypothetical protein